MCNHGAVWHCWKNKKDNELVLKNILMKKENKTLQLENNNLQERLKCSIYLENECNCILTECGRATFCENCLKMITKCHL